MYYHNNRKSCGNRPMNKRIPLAVQEVQEQYTVALQKLYEKNDLESIFFLRIAAETGLRMRDIYDLKHSEIVVRKIHKKSLKTGKYEDYPLISEETGRIAEQLVERQGRFFSRDYQYYMTKIKRQFSDPNMKLLYIVSYKRTVGKRIM